MIHQRQLAAIMFTDIVGYSAMMQHSEEQAVQMIRRYLKVLHHEVSVHNGEVLNDYGDGSLCIFNSAVDALQCSIAMHSQYRQEPAVPLRIGLHIGEIFFEDDKVMGDAVNVASRVQSLGLANTVLVSSEIIAKIRNRPEFQFVPLGSFDFKNIEEPVPVFALKGHNLLVPARDQLTGKLKDKETKKASTKILPIAALGILLFLAILLIIYKPWKTNGPAGPKTRNSIAVLYFENKSNDPEQSYLSDGITEEIIIRLSNVQGLSVKNHRSVAKYKNRQSNIRAIARELGVQKILQGSVKRMGGDMQVVVELIDGQTEENLWSFVYNKPVHEIMNVQSDIARQVVSRFNIDYPESVRLKISSAPTSDPEAYDHYLKALMYAQMESGLGGAMNNNRLAIQLLRRAAQLDTAYADAFAKMAELMLFMAANDPHPQNWIDSADYFATKAISLDPSREQGYISLAHVRSLEGKTDQSLELLMKAEGLHPFSSTMAIQNIHVEKHQFRKAKEWIDKAREYDPYDPEPYAAEAWLFMGLGMMDSVKASLERSRLRFGNAPEFDQPWLHYFMFMKNGPEYQLLAKKIYGQDDKLFHLTLGRYYIFQRNWALADSVIRISSRPDDMDAGLIALNLGNRKRGSELLQKTIRDRSAFMEYYHAWHAYDISRCYAALGDNRFQEYFDKAFAKGWCDHTWMEQDPFFDNVRNTSEFKSLWIAYEKKVKAFREELTR